MENDNTQTPPPLPADNSEDIARHIQDDGQRRKSRKLVFKRIAIVVGILVFVIFCGAIYNSLDLARVLARRAMSATNLHQIGYALMSYQDNNDGKMPTRIELLITEGDLSTRDFINPAYQNRDELKLVDGKLVGEMGYVFFLDIPADAPGDTIVAYEKTNPYKLKNIYMLTLRGVAETTPEELNGKLKSQGRPIANFETGE